jgi:hypothetical protein
MKPARHTVWRSILLAFSLLAAAGLVAPYLSANRFGDRIRQALELSLHRRVEIQSAGFNLFRGPGFTLQRVVIYDDPAAGAEPLAYVNAIEARVSLASLLGGPLEFSALRLEEPSVNVVKSAAGPWNFQQLLNPATAARLPAISVRNGRLNFKLGGVKSVFYFSNTDLDLRPPRSPGDSISLEFSGEPTRSDRTARGFGTLQGRGRWVASPDSAGTLELELNLEKTSMGELVALIHGHDIGVHGQVAGQVRVRGPLSDLDVSGALQMTEIHRWDLLPPYAEGGPLSFRGKLDLLSQDLEIETVPSSQSALTVQFRAFDYLVRPRWVAGVTLNGLPVGPLIEVARHMGAGFPSELQADGAVSGAVSYSPADGFQGSVSLNGTSLRAADGPAVRFEEARLVLEGDHVRLPPAETTIGDGEKATFQMDYAPGTESLELRLATQAMSIAALQSAGGPLPGMPRPDFVSSLRDGVWSGWLGYRQQGPRPGEWTGALKLSETRAMVPGFSQPLAVSAAAVKLHDGGLDATGIQAAAGDLEIRGDCSYRPGATRPYRFALQVPEMEASELGRLMAPTWRRARSFLSRTLRLSPGSVPEWLAGRHAQGTIDIGSLRVAGKSLESVRLGFFWDGPNLEVPRFQARVAGGDAEGYLVVDLTHSAPSFQIAGRLESASWRNGRLEGDAAITTSGSGDDLYWNLRAEGFFRLRSAMIGEETRIPALSGDWSLRWDHKQPRLQLSGLRLTDGPEVLTGEGATTEDQRVEIDLANADKHLRLSGTLKPLRLEVAENR